MSSFLPRINDLNALPPINYNYAKTVLSLVIQNILALDEIEIAFGNQEQNGARSAIVFTVDDLERVIVSLEFIQPDFSLIIEDNSENSETSVFKYRISDHEELVNSIPEGLLDILQEVAYDGQPKTVNPKLLNS